MDHRYKVNYLTQVSIDMALTSIIDIAGRSEVDVLRAQRILIPEFDSYCLMVGDYGYDNDNESAAEW